MFSIFPLCVVWLSVPVQLIAWKDLSPKYPIVCRVGRQTLPTQSLSPILVDSKHSLAVVSVQSADALFSVFACVLSVWMHSTEKSIELFVSMEFPSGGLHNWLETLCGVQYLRH